MTTIRNYYKYISANQISRQSLSPVLRKGWDFVDEVTNTGTDFEDYNSSEVVQDAVKTYLEKFYEFCKEISSKSKPVEQDDASELGAVKGSEANEKKATLSNLEQVESISPELRFMRRFLNLHGRKKDRNQIRLFVNALQRAIRERKITKESKFASEIMEMQDALIRMMPFFKSDKHLIMIECSEEARNKYSEILGEQVEFQSIKFIKSYIALQGKMIENIKVKRLYQRITDAISAKKITKTDKYWKEIELLLKKLKSFIQNYPRRGILTAQPQELKGLAALGLIPEESLAGLPQIVPGTIMTGAEILDLEFKTLGFQGKWLEFIGDPAPGFTAMIFGLPKYGKSILAILFALYLAKNHGKVLYIASEEQIGATLRSKVAQTNARQVHFTDILPEDFGDYDFIFIDSVNNYGLSTNDLMRLKKENPGKSFTYVFQTTKNGNFRGRNEFQHDVDIVIELPEIGKAVQYGRYNQGGSVNVFDGSLEA